MIQESVSGQSVFYFDWFLLSICETWTISQGWEIFTELLGYLPRPTSAVEEHRTTKRKDPGSTPDKGSILEREM